MQDYAEGSSLDRLEKASRAVADLIAVHGDIGEKHPAIEELEVALGQFHGRTGETGDEPWPRSGGGYRG